MAHIELSTSDIYQRIWTVQAVTLLTLPVLNANVICSYMYVD